MKPNKTPQDIINQSQLPNNSSPVTGVVKVCMESLEKLLTPEEQKACEDSNNHFESLLIQFREEVETISNRLGYHYGTDSYEKKLGIFDNVKEKELERLFKENPNIGKIFNEIIEKSNIDSEITKNVLMKEGLEDLILENMEEVNEEPKILQIPKNLRNLMRDNPEEIGRMIKEGKYTSLDLSWNNLNQIFPNNPEAFISLIKIAGENGIKTLRLGINNLNQIFPNNPEAFESFIKTAGKSGIRSLILQGNDLNKIFQNDIKTFESLIKIAGESGIRSLDLYRNNLNQIFQNNPEALLDILSTIGQGNIKYWDLSYNNITQILNSNPTLKTQLESKIEELKKEGITVLY